MKLYKKLFGYCVGCGKYFKYPIKRRLNTAFIEEELNWICSCKDCYEEEVAYYKEMWLEYYMSRQ